MADPPAVPLLQGAAAPPGAVTGTSPLALGALSGWPPWVIVVATFVTSLAFGTHAAAAAIAGVVLTAAYTADALTPLLVCVCVCVWVWGRGRPSCTAPAALFPRWQRKTSGGMMHEC